MNGRSTGAWWTNRNFSIDFPVCSEVASRPPRWQSFVNPTSCKLSRDPLTVVVNRNVMY